MCEDINMFNLDIFIGENVIKRKCSMFTEDGKKNYESLLSKINNKTVLVIGGAGNIGSSYIKAILQFKPASLVVVDTNENALTKLTRGFRSAKGMYMPKEYKTYPICSIAVHTPTIGIVTLNKHKELYKNIGIVDRLFDAIETFFGENLYTRLPNTVSNTEELSSQNIILVDKLEGLSVGYYKKICKSA